MQREPYWDYMRRRLSEEDMRESYFDANDIKILKSQTEELQGQLQEAYKKIKLLREEIFELKKLVPIKQLEFKF